jgi:hypothetical protein
MCSRNSALAGLIGLLFILAGLPAFAQGTGSISGTVRDPSGSVVPGASVTISSQGTGAGRATRTDDTGYYLVPLLPIGTYTIRVSTAGFQPFEQKDVTLQVDQAREVNFLLSTAKLLQSVEVSATAVAVETSNASLGQVITSQQVAELPLNGRDFVQLATLSPGTTQETNPNSFFTGGGSSEVSIRGSYSLSVAGSRPNSTDWLLDGVDNNELTAGGIAVLPDIDVLQEFKVLTFTYSAQYGTRGGPTVLLTTKAGSNAFHGTLFEFLRNTNLDARSFFAPNREVFIQNQFGGSFGGPIKKDKTFFFADYQAKKTRQGKNFLGQVPTEAMRNGDFSETFPDVTPFQLMNPFATGGFPGNVPFMCDSGGNALPADAHGVQAAGTPCNKIPASLINPVAQKMIDLYPLPNNPGPGLLSLNYVNTPVKQFKEGEGDIRLDHNFTSQDTLYARFSYDQATEYLPGGSPGFAEQNAFASTQSLTDHGRNAALSETHVVSPNAVNKATLGFNRIFNHILSYGSGSCEAEKIGIPGANLGGVSCGLTSTLAGGGFWSLGDRGFAPFQGGTNVFFIADSFDMNRGSHAMTFGGEIRANQMNVLASGFQDGFVVYAPVFTGYSMADFLVGLPVFMQHDQTFNGPVTGRRWKLYRPYFEDNWRISPNLTVNLGLAYAVVTPITETYDRQSNFDMRSGNFLIAGKNASRSAGVTTDWTAFEPRIGLAWSPFGDRKTSIRAGYSIYHDSSWNQGAQGLWENPPFFGSFSPPFGTSISQGFTPLLTQPTDPSQYGGNLNSITNLNFKQGRIQQFNINVERELPGNVLLTIGYAGARSNHLLEDGQNVNIASPAGCGTISGYTFGCGQTNVPWPANPLNPNAAIGTILDAYDNGNARYDSLQIKAETKSSHGLYALLGYTYSAAIDNGLSDGLGSNVGALYYPLPRIGRAETGLSQIDLTHNFTASVVYQLPFGRGKRYGTQWSGATDALLGGWEFGVIEHIISGFPIFMIASNNQSGTNFSNNGNSFNRPDRVCNGQRPDWTVIQYFNADCFVDPQAGTLGNASRTPLFGPGLVNTDFSAVKNMRLPFREGTELQFRAEFFNLWNHPQFYQPVNNGVYADIDSAGFGVITSTVNNPRLIQFALKLRF